MKVELSVEEIAYLMARLNMAMGLLNPATHTGQMHSDYQLLCQAELKYADVLTREEREKRSPS